jgi:hypothetical protein
MPVYWRAGSTKRLAELDCSMDFPVYHQGVPGEELEATGSRSAWSLAYVPNAAPAALRFA